MIRFDSDYTEGMHPAILQALLETNDEQTIGYGEDPHCEHARQLIRQAVQCETADVHFLVGGTQANTTVIASILKSYQGVLCAGTGHINCHETGAVEATGHKVLPLASADGTITAAQVEAYVSAHYADGSHEHIVQPGMVYISFPTENGTLYTRTQLMDLHTVCQKRGLPLFVDGARMGYGLAAAGNDISLADFARFSDVFYIGGTKVGALMGEAVVIVNEKLKPDFRYNIKQRGGMLAKGRFLGIQFEQLFQNDLYQTISRHAIDLAALLKDALTAKGYTFRYEPQTNQLFVNMPDAKLPQLQQDFAFSIWGRADDTHTTVRFCTSWATKEDNVKALIASL